jgi:hypothetical protein
MKKQTQFKPNLTQNKANKAKNKANCTNLNVAQFNRLFLTNRQKYDNMVSNQW